MSSGSGDADILVTLTADHGPTAEYVRLLRERLPQEFPGITFAFLPADIVSQILNFGLPSPVDIQIVGASPENRDVANRLLDSLRRVPGLVDLRIQQNFNQPELRVTTDRSRAQQLGLSQRDIASNLLLTLAGSAQLSPTFWLDPKTGVQYSIVTQAPQYRMDSLDDLQNVPVSGPGAAAGPGRSCHDHAWFRAGHRHALQHPARDRHLRRSAGPRPRCRRPRRAKDPGGRGSEAAKGNAAGSARTDADDEPIPTRVSRSASSARSC